MGQKVNPIGLRLGINRTWDSRWYAERGEKPELEGSGAERPSTSLDQILFSSGTRRSSCPRPVRPSRTASIRCAAASSTIGGKGAIGTAKFPKYTPEKKTP
jgi:small subunit ribosomal protein S3